MDEQEMKAFADALWQYMFDKHAMSYFSDTVCYYRAVVVAAPSDGVISVQRPFDNIITLPYAWSASNLNVGDECIVMIFGESSNAIVIGSSLLSNQGLFYSQEILTTDWTLDSGNYYLTILKITHGCGTTPTATLFIQDGTNFQQYVGGTSPTVSIRVDENGNVALKSDSAFDGLIKISM